MLNYDELDSEIPVVETPKAEVPVEAPAITSSIKMVPTTPGADYNTTQPSEVGLDYDTLDASVPKTTMPDVIDEKAFMQQTQVDRPAHTEGTLPIQPEIAKKFNIKSASRLKEERKNGGSDIGLYRTEMLPARAEMEAQYQAAYPDASESDRKQYSKEQLIKSNPDIDEEWIAKMDSDYYKLAPEKQDSILDRYLELAGTGDFPDHASVRNQMARDGYDVNNVDYATMNKPAGYNEFKIKAQDYENKGYFAGAQYAKALGYMLGDSVAGEAQTPLQKERFGPLNAAYLATTTVGLFTSFTSPDTDAGKLRARMQNTREVLNTSASATTRLMSDLAVEIFAGGLVTKAFAPLRLGEQVKTLADAMKKMSWAKSGEWVGQGVVAGGVMAADKKATNAEVATTATVVAMMPYLGKAVYHTGSVVRKIPNWRMHKAKAFIDDIIVTPEARSKFDETLRIIDSLKLYDDMTKDEKYLLAGGLTDSRAAIAYGKTILESRNGQNQFSTYLKALTKQLGKPELTAAQAKSFIRDLVANVDRSVATSNELVASHINSAALTADALDLSNSAHGLLTHFSGLPNDLQKQLDHIFSADKDIQVTAGQLSETINRLLALDGSNKLVGMHLAGELQTTKNSLLQSLGIDPTDAQRMVDTALANEYSAKSLEKVLRTTKIGRDLHKTLINSADAASDVPGIKHIGRSIASTTDTTATSQDITKLLDVIGSISPQARAEAEKLLVDGYAQFFLQKANTIGKKEGMINFASLENTLASFRSSELMSPIAKAKLAQLELVSKLARYDDKFIKLVLNADDPDLAAVAGWVNSLGLGAAVKLVQATFRWGSSFAFKGPAYHNKMLKALEKSTWADNMLGTGTQALDQQDKLFSNVFKALEAEATGQVHNLDAAPLRQNGSGRLSAEVRKNAPALAKFIDDFREYLNNRNQVVNAVFFKRMEGEELNGANVIKLAEAIDRGEVRVGLGEALPIPGENGHMYALGSNLKFKSTHKLAKAMRNGSSVKLTDVLPYKANKAFYDMHLHLKTLSIKPYAEGTPQAQGGHADMANRLIGANVEYKNTGGITQANIDLEGNTVRSDISNILHEIGHFISEAEKLPGGGSPKTIAYIKGGIPKDIQAKAARYGKTSTGEAYYSLMGEQTSEASAGGRTVLGSDGKRYISLDYSAERSSIETTREMRNGKEVVKTRVRKGITAEHKEAVDDNFGTTNYPQNRARDEASISGPTSPEDRAIPNAEKAKVRAERRDGYEAKEGVGIDINSKMKTALVKILNTFPNKEQANVDITWLKNRLLKEGVSKKEIDLMTTQLAKRKADPRVAQLEKLGVPKRGIASTVGEENMVTNDKVSIMDILGESLDNQIEINTISTSAYKNISKGFGPGGEDDVTNYAVRGFSTERDLGVQDMHKVGDVKGNTQLGWSRGWTSKSTDGNNAHVLGEFQSDIAQGDSKELYPIDYSDFKKLAIIDGINQTIEKGFTKMIIPIDRSGALVGSDDIGKMYKELNAGILPKLRQQLAKAGLKIDTKLVDTDITFRDSQVVLKTANEYVGDVANFIDRRDFKNLLEGLYHDQVEGLELYIKLNKAYNKYHIDAKAPDFLRTGKKDGHFEIDIEPKYKVAPKNANEFKEQYKKTHEVAFNNLESTDLIRVEANSGNFGPAEINKITDTYEGSSTFDEMDAFYDIDGNEFYSKRVLEVAGIKPRLPTYVYEDVDGIKLHSHLEDMHGIELGFKSATKAKMQKANLIKDIDEAMTNGTGNVMRPDQEFELSRASSINEMHDIVETWGMPELNDDLWEVYDEARKLTYGKEGYFKEQVVDQIKTRWDMLGVIGALGLTGANEKLKKEQ